MGFRRTIYFCPGYARIPGYFMRAAAPSGFRGSYSYNVHGLAPPDQSLGLGFSHRVPTGPGTFYNVPLPETAVINPSDMIAFGDSPLDPAHFLQQQGKGIGVPILEHGLVSSIYSVMNADARTKAAMARRHSPNWNMLFADGHIEGAKARAFFDRKRQEVLRRWNRDNLPHPEGLVF
jgi:prepilin-type processing-associated H-X9-DG protein